MRLSRLAGPILLLLGCSACVTPPADALPRYGWYVRPQGDLVLADFEANTGNHTQTVSPGWGLTVGGVTDQGYDVAWAMEGTFEWSYHPMDESADANYKRYMFGGRYFWNMDSKFRPSVTFGGAYHTIQFPDVDHEFRTKGYGIYTGLGVDFQLTESWAIGLDWKLHFLYAKNDDQGNFVLWSVVGLTLAYYF